MSFLLPKQSNSYGEDGVSVGTTPDGAAPAGIGVGFNGGAVWAGVVRSGGEGGDGRAAAAQ
jgi:hypothetical protein